MENNRPPLDSDERIYRKLTESPFLETYRRAFASATGLDFVLVPAGEGSGGAPRLVGGCSGFCAAVNENERGRRRCAMEHRCLSREVGSKAETRTCYAGLRETLVPVNSGGRAVAYLSAGQVFAGASGREKGFARVAEELRRVGVAEAELERLAPVWEATPEIALDRYEGAVTLLAAFALQLSELLNRLVTEETNSEPQIVVRAKRFINAHLEERLSLDSVAGHVGVSPFYFCKLFKQATGMTLTEYVNRRRIEWAKRKLVSPNARVTEVAFDVGFQSVSQFNRSFLKYAGVSPTRFRSEGVSVGRLARAEAA
jgi:AraC-like DNA-binding protein/ligand-binding sensor protein